MDGLREFLLDYTVRNVIIGSAILGVVSGSLGSFAVLRKQSLLGDAISHAALPGIALAFLVTQSKAPFVLVAGAAVAGWLGTVLILSIIRNTRIKEDGAMGIILSVFFGIGLVILTFIQKMPNAAKAGLDKFLFGQAATMLVEDIVTMGTAGGLAMLVMLAFWKELKVLSFDREYGASLSIPMGLVEGVLTVCLVIAIVIGLQAVGVVLMSAMVVTPAVCARQWTDRLGKMVVLAALFGAMSGVIGSILSSVVTNLPTGPTIVIVLTLFMAISILFGGRRGLIWKAMTQWRNRKRYALDGILHDLYSLASQHDSRQYGHPEETIRIMRKGKEGVQQGLAVLETKGYVEKLEDGSWALTRSGVLRAESLGGEA